MTKMNLQEKLNPTTTALLIIDIQNDFCSPAGLMASMGKNIAGMDSMIEKLHSLQKYVTKIIFPSFIPSRSTTEQS